MYSSTPKSQYSALGANGQEGRLDARKSKFVKQNPFNSDFTLPNFQTQGSDEDLRQSNMDLSNSGSNKWLKQNDREGNVSTLSEQSCDSLRWVSPSRDDTISEGSICASSQILQERLVLLDLEAMNVKDPSISVVTIPDEAGSGRACFSTKQHGPAVPSNVKDEPPPLVPTDSGLGDDSVGNFSKSLLDTNEKASPSSVLRLHDVLDRYDDDDSLTDCTFSDGFSRPTAMPYFPSDIIQRLSPVFNDEPVVYDDDTAVMDSSSPQQVAPIGHGNRTNSTWANHYMYYIGDASTSDAWSQEVDASGSCVADISSKVGDSETGFEPSEIGEHRSSFDELNMPRSKVIDSAIVKGYGKTNDILVSDKLLTAAKPCDDTVSCKSQNDISLDPVLPISSRTIEQLPEELIFKILWYLKPHELCLCVAPVSRKWRDYANHPILWQSLDLSHYPDLDMKHLFQLFRRAYLLKWLNLRGWSDPNLTVINHIGHHCTMLQDINLSFCDNIDGSILAAITGHCKLLTVVNVEGCESIDDAAAFQFTFLPELRVLNMSHCTKITDVVILDIAKLCHNLEALNIDGIPWITDNAINCLASKRCTTLLAMFIDGAELTDNAIQCLTACHKLHTLSISFCDEFSDRTLTCIKRLNSLKHLRLKKGVQFTAPALADVFLSDNMASLTYLDLTECSELCDRGMYNLTRVCKSLQHLALCWCWEVSDIGLEYIVDNCSHLEVLDLLGVRQITGKCLIKIPKCMPHLILLDLRDCNQIQDSVLVRLVNAKPSLGVLNYYGEVVNVCTCIEGDKNNFDMCENACNPLIDH